MSKATTPTESDISPATRLEIERRREELEALAESDLPAAPIAEALLARIE